MSVFEIPPAIPRPCGCWRCHEERGEQIRHMIVCPTCGAKRCPHAADHDLACTGSNDTGQPGSAYEHGSGAASVRRLLPVFTCPTHGCAGDVRWAATDEQGSHAPDCTYPDAVTQ
jgi:hypothetical protein